MSGSAGGGVELTKVILGGFVGVELLVDVQLSGRQQIHKEARKDANKAKIPIWDVSTYTLNTGCPPCPLLSCQLHVVMVCLNPQVPPQF